MAIIGGGTGGGATGAMVQLYSLTLGADGTFDQSGITGAYNDLLLVLVGRGTRASGSDLIGVRFNNDSGANYDTQELKATTTTVSGLAQAGVTLAQGGWVPAATATSGYFSTSQMYIAGYASTTWTKTINTTCQMLEQTAGNPTIEQYVSIWRTTNAAITRVQVFGTTTANFLAGSTLRIYGIL